MAAGLLPLTLADTRPSILLAGLVLSGTGFALTIAPLQAAALDAAAVGDAGAAAGLFSTSRYIGSIVGSLVLSAVVATQGSSVDGVSTIGALVAAAALFATVTSFGLPGPALRRPASATIPARE
jgi:DHA2 family methylenomycin A resistance protein-like MFS transporter